MASVNKTTKKKKRKNRNAVSNFGAVLISLASIAFFTGIIVLGFVGINALSVINGDAIIAVVDIKDSLNQTTFLYATDSHGEDVEIAQLHGTENRVWADLGEIPELVQQAFVALEDKTFYEHHGVNWRRTIGVAIKNDSQGGSTITQQLIKNITGNNETTYVRKYHEILTALNLERAYEKEGYEPKKVILEGYLNTIYLGRGAYGVKAAAETYFDKELDKLTLAEIATIAATTKNPYSSDPIAHYEKNRTRFKYCLDCMLEEGYINKSEYDEAMNEELNLNKSGKVNSKEEKEEETTVQGFYTDFVIKQVINDLMKSQNCTRSEASSMIYGGGLKIYTAVDLEIQEILEDVYENKKAFVDKKDAQSSMTIMDYEGRVVGIIGQAGEKTENRCLNRATDSPRPPGSTIKPLSAYAPGLELDEITWSTSILDKSCTTVGGRPWPKNYSGNYGSGSYVTVQNALARSLNTIPARIIQDDVGTGNSYKYLTEQLGFTTLKSGVDDALQRLAIGGFTYGVTTLELTAAYCSLGNGGKYFKPYSYYKVKDSNDDVILDNTNNEGKQVFSGATADIMREMMKTVITSSVGTGKGYGIYGFETFAKTGTTDDYKDRWFAGGTPYYFASVWYGYDTPKVINAKTNPAGDIFKEVLDRVHDDYHSKDFDKHGDIVEKYYCPTCGKLSSYSTGSSNLGWFKADNLPGNCSGHASLNTEEPDDTTSTEEPGENIGEETPPDSPTDIEPGTPDEGYVPEED